jgi:hypothetical protein
MPQSSNRFVPESSRASISCRKPGAGPPRAGARAVGRTAAAHCGQPFRILKRLGHRNLERAAEIEPIRHPPA